MKSLPAFSSCLVAFLVTAPFALLVAACSSSSGHTTSTTAPAAVGTVGSACAAIVTGDAACKAFTTVAGCQTSLSVYSEAFTQALTSCAKQKGCAGAGVSYWFGGLDVTSACAKAATDAVDPNADGAPDVTRGVAAAKACTGKFSAQAESDSIAEGEAEAAYRLLAGLSTDARAKAAQCAGVACADMTNCLFTVFGAPTP